jgi:flavin-dependent dehydrogenase
MPRQPSRRCDTVSRRPAGDAIQELGNKTDILVVGGGPAGSTAAALLARRGWDVTLVERDRHPRFHIGESLLPLNMPIFERLGVLDQVQAIGVRKLGADFPAQSAQGYGVFRFSRTLNPCHGYAFHVRRDEFDQLLFRHASASGARTLEGLRVTHVELGRAGAVATLQASGGPQRRLEARYLIDATGRDALLGAQLRLRRKDAKHQSAALFAHFSGVARRPGEDAGNISIYVFDHGWIWLIPLPGDCMSIGAVCWPEYLKQRAGRNEEFLLETLRSVPQVKERMAGARIRGNLHATGNYSYVCTRMSGRRWIMVGDAYAFLDPIFSTGVYLAMRSAEHGAGVVDAALREPRRERALQRRYAQEVRRGLGILSWFIYRFTSPAMRQLFASPNNTLRLEEAMISMLAGDVFAGRRVWWRLQVFKLIYLVVTLGMWRTALTNFRIRRRQLHERFQGDTTSHDPA